MQGTTGEAAYILTRSLLMTYFDMESRSSSRTWGCIFAIAVHAVILYLMLLTSRVAPQAAPSDIQVKYIPPRPPEEKIPAPLPPESSSSAKLDIQIPVVNVVASPPPTPISNVDSVDDMDEVSHQNVVFKAETISKYTVKPKPISMRHTMDDYPVESIRAKESGRTTLKVCISATGMVDSVSVSQSSGFPRLDKAAVKIARDYRFKPAYRNGKPVVACVDYGIVFNLGNFRQLHTQERPEPEATPQDESTTQVSALVQESGNPDIGPTTSPVPIRTYLKVLTQYGVVCNSTQLRVIGQDIHDHRYVIEAQCPEQPKGLVVFLPLSDAGGKFESLDCEAAAKRQINCEFEIRK